MLVVEVLLIVVVVVPTFSIASTIMLPQIITEWFGLQQYIIGLFALDEDVTSLNVFQSIPKFLIDTSETAFWNEITGVATNASQAVGVIVVVVVVGRILPTKVPHGKSLLFIQLFPFHAHCRWHYIIIPCIWIETKHNCVSSCVFREILPPTIIRASWAILQWAAEEGTHRQGGLLRGVMAIAMVVLEGSRHGGDGAGDWRW
mmetsp:Transcript_10258/g.29256  ORF Transcript_10258/g.29256 Transcript_10258/m.29256 type:complete len:202 (-) Transcript_10258:169-774(-)